MNHTSLGEAGVVTVASTFPEELLQACKRRRSLIHLPLDFEIKIRSLGLCIEDLVLCLLDFVQDLSLTFFFFHELLTLLGDLFCLILKLLVNTPVLVSKLRLD